MKRLMACAHCGRLMDWSTYPAATDGDSKGWCSRACSDAYAAAHPAWAAQWTPVGALPLDTLAELTALLGQGANA